MASVHGADPYEETEDQAALRQLARDVGHRAVAPAAKDADLTGELSKDALAALAGADLFRVTIGERWGGLGLGDVEAAIVLEEIARHDVSTAICCQLAFNGPARGIEHLGGDALKDRWLPRVADGDAIVSIGITEPDAGSAVQNMRSSLVEDGPGRFRLNGYKNYSTLGDVAQGILVWCRWPGGEGANGIGAVIVPMDREGVAITGRHHGMGIHAATEAEVAFDGVAIERGRRAHRRRPRDDRGVQGAARPPQPRAVRQRRHVRGGGPGGARARGALPARPEVDGRPIGDLQGLRWKAADMAVQLEGARLLLTRAVHLAGPGGTPPPLETAMAKMAANLAAKFVCDEAMQIHGGYGYSHEYPVERAYRDIRGLCFGAGTVEAQRNYVGGAVVAGRSSVSPGWMDPLAD